MRIIYSATGLSSLGGIDWSSAIRIPSPDAFHSIDPFRAAEDRRSQGGRLFSRLLWQGWRGELVWTVLTQAERDSVYAWWQATRGWRVPFALEDDDGARYLGTMPTEMFPLRYVGGSPSVYSMDGAVTFVATEREVP
jgi:hypothetical protein